MKLINKLIVSVALLSSGSVYAMPGMTNPYANYPYKDGTLDASPYVGGIIGLTNYTGTAYYSDGTEAASSTQSGGVGIGGTIGVMINQFFGVELSYMRFGEANGKNSKGEEERDYFTAPMINLKGVLPFGNGFNIFGQLGFSSVTAHSNLIKLDNKNYSGLNLGLGAGYYFTPNVEGTISYFATMINTQGNSTFTPSIFSFGLNIHV